MAKIQKTLARGWQYFLERGVRETVRKTVLHFERKRSERQFVRRMMPSEEKLAEQRAESAAWEIRCRFTIRR